ncbi:probable 4-coumarate--CoA ligase 2 [Orussus abietinus]|uniref:probable 4-coumarate--CoA ligase 2 n=1 Tax=Orussus abietinus TaxID=222816 RepID=UPI000625FE10|nr:probable 4-coumarate--CoA ligase 2 [Orussus abietinus]
MIILREISMRGKMAMRGFSRSYVRRYSTAVIKSPFGNVTIPDQTLSQFVWSRSAKWEELPAVTCGVTGRFYTYGMAKMLHNRGAKALLERVRLNPGDRVGLLLPNIPEYLITVHSCAEAGLTITFANPLYTAEELVRQFKNAEVKCIITVPQLLETALKVMRNLPNYTQTISIGGDTEPDKNVLGMQSLLAENYDVTLPEVKSTDVAVLPYSSGTTGLPKGVMLSHKNLVANLMQVSHPEVTNVLSPSEGFQETILTVLPFFHIYGFNAILNFLIYHGGHIITMPRFTPEDYLQCLEKYKPTVLFVVPSLLLFLATHPSVTPQRLDSIKRIVCGAAPASKNLIDKFKQKLNHDDCVINQGYGMTETSPVTLYTPQSMPSSKVGSCGQLVPSTEARIIDLTNGTDITEPLKPGELLVKGPQIMKGYLNNPKATSEVIDSNGWLHTGDVGYYDDDGYFYIVDRTKELIKVKGNQVSPTELESILLELPEVADVAVVGVPDTLAGELPKAFIVKKPNTNLTAEIINHHIDPKVAAYKRLTGGITFIDAIPRNPSGKILRNQLKVLGK